MVKNYLKKWENIFLTIIERQLLRKKLRSLKISLIDGELLKTKYVSTIFSQSFKFFSFHT